MTQPRGRQLSIDVFRAITMLLMIFVNDLWTLKGIPQWLGHTAAATDGMGLADVVFPAFLFIVGLSIPYAIEGRKARGEVPAMTTLYILSRSFALLLMGFFHVNLESYSKEALLPKPIWQIAITVGFFLIWLDYSPAVKRANKIIIQGSGVLILVLMALIYKGGDSGEIVWMRPKWWGILGLIGWAYLLSAGIFFLSKGRLWVVVAAMLFFLFFNMASHAGWLSFLSKVRPYVWISGGGSSPALTMAGVVTSVIYMRLSQKGSDARIWVVLISFALCMLALGFALRPFWGISKIRATPSWTILCTGISIICLVILIFVVDRKKKHHWFKLIKPAGTSTLTCYLLPYIHYGMYSLAGVSLPLYLRTGGIGIIKSAFYALSIILVTGLLEKWRLRLRI